MSVKNEIKIDFHEIKHAVYICSSFLLVTMDVFTDVARIFIAVEIFDVAQKCCDINFLVVVIC